MAEGERGVRVTQMNCAQIESTMPSLEVSKFKRQMVITLIYHADLKIRKALLSPGIPEPSAAHAHNWQYWNVCLSPEVFQSRQDAFF